MPAWRAAWRISGRWNCCWPRRPGCGGGRSLADKKLSTQLVAAEMALKGVTAAYDLSAEAPLPTQDGMDAMAEAYAEVGMRAVIAPMVADRTVWDAVPGLRDALPAALRAEVEAIRSAPGDATLAAMRDILQHWRWGAADIRAALAPTIPLHCADEFLCGCGAAGEGVRRPAAEPCRREQAAGAGRHAALRPDAGGAAGQAWFGRPRLLRGARHLADR